MSYDFESVWSYSDLLLSGLRTTLELTMLAFLLGGFFGLLVALLRMSRLRFVSTTASVLVNVTLATPVPVQLFLAFYGIPNSLGWTPGAFSVLLAVLSWNQAMIMGENFRAGLQAVPSGQNDAVHVLGLGRLDSLVLIRLPQAVRAMLPAIVSSTVNLLKDSSLATLIGLGDLMSSGTEVALRTFRPIETYIVVAAIYFVVAYPFVRWSDRLEAQMTGGQGR